MRDLGQKVPLPLGMGITNVVFQAAGSWPEANDILNRSSMGLSFLSAMSAFKMS